MLSVRLIVNRATSASTVGVPQRQLTRLAATEYGVPRQSDGQQSTP